jgi:hypothetical protein
VYCSFIYFVVCPIIDEVVYHSHVSIRGRGNCSRSSSSDGRGKDCFGLSACFGGSRRSDRSNVFEEK